MKKPKGKKVSKEETENSKLREALDEGIISETQHRSLQKKWSENFKNNEEQRAKMSDQEKISMKIDRKELIFLRRISEDEHEILAMHPADDRIVSVYRLIGTIKLKPGIDLPAGWGRLEEESNDNERNRN